MLDCSRQHLAQLHPLISSGAHRPYDSASQLTNRSQQDLPVWCVSVGVRGKCVRFAGHSHRSVGPCHSPLTVLPCDSAVAPLHLAPNRSAANTAFSSHVHFQLKPSCVILIRIRFLNLPKTLSMPVMNVRLPINCDIGQVARFLHWRSS